MIPELTPTENLVYKAILKDQCYTPRDVNKKLSLGTRQAASNHVKAVIRKLGYENITQMVLQESRKYDQQGKAQGHNR